MQHVDRGLVGGASLYWAGMGIVFLMTAFDRSQPLWGVIDTRGITCLLMVGLLIAAIALHRGLLQSRVRRALAMGTAALCGMLAVVAAFGVALPPWLARSADAVVISSFMVLWGFAFASMDKRHAGVNASAALLVAVVLMLAAIAVSPLVPPMLFARGCETLSAVVLIGGSIRFEDCPRERVRTPVAHRELMRFVLSRVAFGLFIEFSLCMPGRMGPAGALPLLLAGGVVICGVSLAVYMRAPARLYAAMPLAVLVGMGALFLPFANGGLAALVGILPALVWIPWSVLSSFQLSDLKERLGMGELRLSLFEKVLFAVGLALGMALCQLVFRALGCNPTSLLVYEVLALVFVAFTLVTSYTISSLVGYRKDDEVRDELARTRRERLDVVYDQLAADYGLSAREREVMEMLASGYTSSYVRDTLGISDGTAKAHVAHIYQKLGVHSRNDLLELVEGHLEQA